MFISQNLSCQRATPQILPVKGQYSLRINTDHNDIILTMTGEQLKQLAYCIDTCLENETRRSEKTGGEENINGHT